MHNEEILDLKWRDKWDVYVFSSIMTPLWNPKEEMVPSKKKCIHDYNLFMEGVDYNDQMLQPYLATRTSIDW